MKKIILFAALALTAASCELDYFPSDAMTSEQLNENPTSAIYSTDGNYAMFKDVMAYKGTTDRRNSYIRHYFQMSEFRGDNVALFNKTEDPLYGNMCYSDLATDLPVTYFWWCAYHIIYSANAIIEGLQPGMSAEYDHILGENYFMRAICHLHLATLYAKPYSMGRENPGVILNTSTVTNNVRATVGQVYDQVRDDLITAAGLMAADESRTQGYHGYISRDAALGLLSRVYLYREENDKVIETVNAMLDGADAASKLDPDCEGYFAKAQTSDETLWCVTCLGLSDDPDWDSRETIGSMYYTADSRGSSGWAEMYYSDTLLELFKRHPEDRRYTGFCKQLNPTEGQMQVRWAVDDGSNFFRSNELRDVEYRPGTGYVTSDGLTVEEEVVNGQTRYYMQWNGERCRAYIDTKCEVYNTAPIFMCAKFTGQDGVALLSSPVMIRWAEVILNRAEAYAKSGNAPGALNDVNAIRQRAGLSGNALYTESNLTAAGYADALEVVLDERRLELCYEGHRAIDIFRNKRSLDRRFAGVQPWEVVDYTDPRILYRIPYDEISVSGIPQND